MSQEYDNREGYCKILGHFLTFKYCRSSNQNLPCSKILDCWFQDFSVEDYIVKHYSKDEQKNIFTPPKPKICSLTEILEQAQKRIRENE